MEKAKNTLPSLLTGFRNGIKYTERLFQNWGKTFSWIYKNFSSINRHIYVNTNSGSDVDKVLRFTGITGNIILNSFLLCVLLLWDFLRSI